MELIVPDDKLSLAIGKKGQNVRLASQLTGWRIDIHSESKIRELETRARLAGRHRRASPPSWPRRCSSRAGARPGRWPGPRRTSWSDWPAFPMRPRPSGSSRPRRRRRRPRRSAGQEALEQAAAVGGETKRKTEARLGACKGVRRQRA